MLHVSCCTFVLLLFFRCLAAVIRRLKKLPVPALKGKGVTPANQTKERSVHELFAGAFRNKSSRCESCLFSQGKNTRIHKNGRNSWTFRFGPFFGLVCRGDSWWKAKNVAKNLAPVLLVISGNSLVFSRKVITSTGFYQCCAPWRVQHQ